jgi:hypothetical protein
MAFGVSVSLTLQDQPNWCDDKIHFTREGDEILIEVYRESGYIFCRTRVTIDDFNKMADLLLTP